MAPHQLPMLSDRPRQRLRRQPDGCLYSRFSLTDVNYKRELLSCLWERAPEMHNSRNNPLLGLVQSSTDPKAHKLIVAGGVYFFEEDDLAVEIYDSSVGSWELCQRLPVEFRENCSRHWMTSAVAGGKFYIAEKYCGATAVFDFDSRVWSSVRTVRPPGVVHSHLLSCQGRLLLAGSCYVTDTHSFKIWEVNEESMECGSAIATMPTELLSSCFDSSEDGQERKGEALQCVACGDLIYVYFPSYSRELTRGNQMVVCDSSEEQRFVDIASSPSIECILQSRGWAYFPCEVGIFVRQKKDETLPLAGIDSEISTGTRGIESEIFSEIEVFQRIVGHSLGAF